MGNAKFTLSAKILKEIKLFWVGNHGVGRGKRQGFSIFLIQDIKLLTKPEVTVCVRQKKKKNSSYRTTVLTSI